MLDLNDLRVFATVASLQSFSAAARTLQVPRSSVSRVVARLEGELGTRLVQRTTRNARLTESGTALQKRCDDILARVGETRDFFASISVGPRGLLKISCSIGFGYDVLAELLPQFLERHAAVDVSLELTSRCVDLVAEGVDVAIRMGPMPDSGLVAARLGTIRRYLCAAPSYLRRRGAPRTLEELHSHDAVEMPGADGRPRNWTFFNSINQRIRVEARPRMSANDLITIHRLVVNGAGIACLPGHLCAPDIQAGRLAWLFPEWSVPDVEVNAVFPSNRELSPTVRAFVEFMKDASMPGNSWQRDELSGASHVCVVDAHMASP